MNPPVLTGYMLVIPLQSYLAFLSVFLRVAPQTICIFCRFFLLAYTPIKMLFSKSLDITPLSFYKHPSSTSPLGTSCYYFFLTQLSLIRFMMRPPQERSSYLIPPFVSVTPWRFNTSFSSFANTSQSRFDTRRRYPIHPFCLTQIPTLWFCLLFSFLVSPSVTLFSRAF